MNSKNYIFVVGLCVTTVFLVACSEFFSEDQEYLYESSDPYVDRSRYQTSDATTTDVVMDSAADVGEEAPSDDDPERIIEEADIIKVVGTTLYALSSYRGLVVIDIANPDALAVLGRFPVYGSPFEMYVREGVAYVIFSSFWTYELDETTFESSWNTTAMLVAIDIHDPANMGIIRTFDLMGEISDSRLVGDVIYLVAYESAYCWGCDDTPSTTITSVSVADPDGIHLVDRLSYDEDGYGGYRRSISVTTERMYVSGMNYSDSKSEIHVVDISDPGGDLVEGAIIQLEGMIESRWQMDEYEGVLRVISQPGFWGSSSPPVVQTFQVLSATEIVELGRLDMVLPRPEDLRSVRFDGPRAYAVTFQRTDPLFTIDLTDPANPVQRGELEIPGWLYYMAPMGERLVALGFNEDNSLAVSLFDVSDLDAPLMLDRVSFGADWGWMPEDQDRIHKALNIMPERNLILMPFSGWSYYQDEYGYRSGIQIIEWAGDDLILRAVAPHRGFARRAFIAGERLIAMSDERIDVFDIDNLDAPVRTNTLHLARNIYRIAPAGDHVAELSSDWWSEEARLDILPVDNPDSPDPAGTLDLSFINEERSVAYYFWWSNFYYSNSILFSHGNTVILLWEEGGYSYDLERYVSLTKAATFDVSDPAHPAFIARVDFDVPFPRQRGFWSYGPVQSGSSIVQIGSTVLMVTSDNNRTWYYDEEEEDPDWRIEVLDFSDPAGPRRAEPIRFPDGLRIGGMFVEGTTLITSHHVDASGDRVAFFLDRIDMADPDDPQFAPSINVPGSVAGIDTDGGRVVTVDYQLRVYRHIDSSECYQMGYDTDYDYVDDTCYVMDRVLNILALEDGGARRLKQLSFEDGFLRSVYMTGTRLFVGLMSSAYTWWDGDGTDPRPELLVIPLDDPDLNVSSSIRMSSPYTWLTGAVGNKAIVVSDTPPAVSIYDATDPAGLTLQKESRLTGYAYDMHILDDEILSANARWGVQSIDL